VDFTENEQEKPQSHEGHKVFHRGHKGFLRALGAFVVENYFGFGSFGLGKI
jgi:hypothetical protein